MGNNKHLTTQHALMYLSADFHSSPTKTVFHHRKTTKYINSFFYKMPNYNKPNAFDKYCVHGYSKV